MKAIKNVCAKIKYVHVKKSICILALISVVTFMSSCTAEELPLNVEEEITVPVDGVEADGDVEGGPIIIIFTPPTTPPKK
jgi:hypothetical protein